MVYASLLAALTGASAVFAFPIGPVPITLQVLFVLLSGGLLGPKWGPVSMGLYLLLGLVGLPVFAGGTSGIGHLLGPTGGYMVGFVLSSFVVGLMMTRTRSLPWVLLAMVVALMTIYGLGICWLSLAARMPLSRALAVGLLPFLPADALKVVIAALVVSRMGTLLGPRP
jgi:biotin transport system substrate-specific component